MASGLNPWSYHVVNVTLHATVSALLAWTCHRCLRLSTATSTLTAFLFAIHPIHTEAVSLSKFMKFGSYIGNVATEQNPKYFSFWSSRYRDMIFWNMQICRKMSNLRSLGIRNCQICFKFGSYMGNMTTEQNLKYILFWRSRYRDMIFWNMQICLKWVSWCVFAFMTISLKVFILHSSTWSHLIGN